MNIITDDKIKLTEQGVEYKKKFRWHTINCADITQAYMRIEQVSTTLCCGRTNFDLHFLVMKTADGEMVKAEVTSRDLVKQMLDELKARNSSIEIGFKKEA